MIVLFFRGGNERPERLSNQLRAPGKIQWRSWKETTGPPDSGLPLLLLVHRQGTREKLSSALWLHFQHARKKLSEKAQQNEEQLGQSMFTDEKV